MSREKNALEDDGVTWTPFWLVKRQSLLSRSRNQTWLVFQRQAILKISH